MSTLFSKMSLIAVLGGLLLSQQAGAQTFYRNGETYTPGRTSLLPPPRSSSASTTPSSTATSGSGVTATGSGSIETDSSSVESEPAIESESSASEVTEDSSSTAVVENTANDTEEPAAETGATEAEPVDEPADSTEPMPAEADDSETSSSFGSIEEAFPEFADTDTNDNESGSTVAGSVDGDAGVPPVDDGLSLNAISMIVLFILVVIGGIGYALWRWRQGRELYEVQPAPQEYIPGPWDDQKSKLKDAIDDMRNDYLS